MILITGAAGKTGQAVLRALVGKKAPVRVLTHTQGQADQLLALGAIEAISGDVRDPEIICRVLSGVEKIYHICPNVAPDEFELGKTIIAEAKAAGVSHFVYHSVLHPQIEAMPHHWQKMRVEEILFASSIDFTILQPCAYMQNLLAGWQAITKLGVYSVPYSLDARISIVDLEDVGAAAAEVLTCADYRNGVYELSGPEALSQKEVAETLGKILGRQIQAVQQGIPEWTANARNSGIAEYALKTLVKMFDYYDEHGLVGSPIVLETILGRQPHKLADFIAWYNQSSQ